MTNQIIENYLSDAIQSFRNYKKLAERALEQVSDEEFFKQIDEESNSLAIIVKHIAGNLKSRWTHFLTSDGEKDFRDRDSEFIAEGDTRESLMAFWEEGWEIIFNELGALKAEDFSKTITIRQQSHTICEAINRQLTHYAYHIGQVTFLAKHFRSTDWKNLSVPKNKSSQFNSFMAENKDDKRKQVELAREFAEKKL
jgi:uncharacterized damage-inducible protein DinB